MKDKEIRKILIEYLKAKNNRIRIYQEKSIGNSICDIMAVTDELIGYEIKSDSDNYTRLSSQVVAYNNFFERNYVVVSAKHSRTIQNYVPEHWGILFINDSHVTELRGAKKNSFVNRKKQLSILWKLELKNLLIINNLPSYAQKEKGYIAGEIANNVPSDKLAKQIAQELLNRDYSVFGADDYTINYIGESEMPITDIVDRLSEANLTDDMTLDKWIAIYNKAKTIREKKNIAVQSMSNTPVSSIEHIIKFEDIEITLGVPWVKPYMIQDFCKDLLEIPDCLITYEEITGNWYVANKKYYGDNYKGKHQYGLERYNALQIIEASLNLREIKLFDFCNKLNEEDTLLALEKQRLINEEFKVWIGNDEDRRWIIEEEYNRLFSKYSQIQHDGGKLSFPEMSENYTLYSYQKDAVQKIISTKNTLLAFDVGAGKTYIMIAAAMKLKELGISQKNLFVVPNNIVGQFLI